jgi:predicted DNA-binding transcriptional regulator AlpA
MAGSPALKIVRHAKPSGDVKNGPRLAGGGQSAAKPTVAANEPPPFTMTDVEIARELRLSAKTIGRMNADGKLPQPVTVGARSLRWVRQTIVEWLAAGCPDRATFEANQKGGV